MGAVFPIPYIYASELCPPNRRGRFTGWADSFLSFGYFLSPLLALLLDPQRRGHARLADHVHDRRHADPVRAAGVAIPARVTSVARIQGSLGPSAEVGPERKMEAHGRALDWARPRPPSPPRSTRPAPPVPTSVARRSFAPPLRRRAVTLWVTFGGTFFIFYSIQIFMPTVVTSMGYLADVGLRLHRVIVGVSIPGKLSSPGSSSGGVESR